ncbi:MAG: 5'-Nucleotidase domain protein [Ignavibacteria bacterium]|nr:5'-Nucleotidase domain protein [Ignavibacteria bacterium]
MKFLRNLSLIIALIPISYGISISEKGESLPLRNNAQNQPLPVCIGSSAKVTKNSKDKILGVSWYPMDSLANSLSYSGDMQQPLVYEPTHKTVVTIKRGHSDPKSADYDPKNSKNNIYVRTSTNLGQSWEPSVKVYDAITVGIGEGRYPSCQAYDNNGKLGVAFAFPLVYENNGVWPGIVIGNLEGTKADITYIEQAFEFNKKNYNIGRIGHNYTTGADFNSITDTKMAAWRKGSAPFALIVSDCYPTYGDTLDNNNIPLISTADFSDFKINIPPQWANNKWGAASKFTRTSMPVALKRANGKVYLGAFGNLLAEGNDKRAEVGVSVSTDDGVSWSDFDFCSNEVIRNYASDNDINPDSCMINYTSKDFVVFDESNDYSFAAWLQEFDASKSRSERAQHAVEIYKENGVWGIRKIGDIIGDGLTVPLWDDTQGTPQQVGAAQDVELQLSRSEDGSKLIAKWIGMLGVVWVTDSTFQFEQTEIFVSSRAKNSSSWMATVQITDDPAENPEIERNTWIPDIVPNDLQNIPILRVQAMGYTPGTDLASLRTQTFYLRAQYVMAGQFNSVVGVDEEPKGTASFDINGIYPNPADNITSVNFTIPKDGNIEIEIFNIMGQKQSNVYSGYASYGVRSINIPTGDLTPGTYFVSLTSASGKIIRKLNIFR